MRPASCRTAVRILLRASFPQHDLLCVRRPADQQTIVHIALPTTNAPCCGAPPLLITRHCDPPILLTRDSNALLATCRTIDRLTSTSPNSTRHGLSTRYNGIPYSWRLADYSARPHVSPSTYAPVPRQQMQHALYRLRQLPDIMSSSHNQAQPLTNSSHCVFAVASLQQTDPQVSSCHYSRSATGVTRHICNK